MKWLVENFNKELSYTEMVNEIKLQGMDVKEIKGGYKQEVGYYPDSVFCIDICETNDGEFFLLEINSFSSAGLYACKLPPIVKRVSEIALKEWQTIHNIC